MPGQENDQKERERKWERAKKKKKKIHASFRLLGTIKCAALKFAPLTMEFS